MDDIWLKTSHLLAEVERCISDDLQHTVLHSTPIATIYALAALYKKDGQKVGDIADGLGVARTSFTPTIDRLERLGLVERGASPNDRRAVYVHLTKEGKKLETAVMNAIGNAEVRYGGG